MYTNSVFLCSLNSGKVLIEQSVALIPPKYLYPLGGESFTYDVINNQDGIFPNSTDCFTVGPNHPQLSFSAMYFDRNVNKYADVRIPSDNSISNIGFTVLFNALDPSGYLFHYRSDNQGNINFITEMYVKIDNGQVISKIDSSGYSTSPLVFPVGANGPHTISLNTWIMISLTNSAVNGTTYLFIDTLVEQFTHGFNFSVKTPGKLRFGASLLSPYNAFHGFMTCGALYNVASGFDNITEILQKCSEKNWPNSPPNITTNINFNSWILLGILRETNQLLVSIDDSIFHISDTCGSFGLSGNAYIEIGNSERGSIGFRGSMRCLVLFNELLDTNVGSTMDHYCTSAQSDAVANVINNCDVQPLSERKYLLLRHNMKPVNTFQQLSSAIFRSLPACAAHCFTLAYCRSFTYNDSYCVTYDEVTAAGLIDSPGLRYFILAI
ncbi:hypothetical protein LOTGIDRAFT_163662 [Lottia gigantea]|uniref:Apple domain-containing protein n=1 Tax=Lottia gigantea TaxID=225164 RepID=V4A6Y6_LOTGI|nr:hypothetical protein LOTGIDRAFT_163662 [Lottia gigantea]ESO90780.1 hypothetical protein LOTGIDRAFT_163662 [Lottia gigantea]